MYKDMFRDRGMLAIEQYETPELRYPSMEEIGTLTNIQHTWKIGDRFYKLADKYYDDVTMWWVIAQFNKAPTEAHLYIGQTIFIPKPLEAILEYFDY